MLWGISAEAHDWTAWKWKSGKPPTQTEGENARLLGNARESETSNSLIWFILLGAKSDQ